MLNPFKPPELAVLAMLGDPHTRPGGALDPRVRGNLVQRELSPGVLGRIGKTVVPRWPQQPAAPARLRRPRSITEARGLLVQSRTRWTELRVRVQTQPGWTRRSELDAARLDALMRARSVLWETMPAKLIALARTEPVEPAVAAVLRQLGDDVARELLVLVHPGRGLHRGGQREDDHHDADLAMAAERGRNGATGPRAPGRSDAGPPLERGAACGTPRAGSAGPAPRR
jgi:hypothetical protein